MKQRTIALMIAPVFILTTAMMIMKNNRPHDKQEPTPTVRPATQALDEFELHRHGIYIRKGSRSGTFLPQVADEVNWTKEEFVGHCSRDKAGLGWNGWRDAELYVYEAIIF